MADIWDSGRIPSGNQAGIGCKGVAIESATRYYWTVSVWDGKGRQSPYAEPAWLETGLLTDDDWEASWISADNDTTPDPGPAPYFRKEFSIEKKVASARLYISGLGYYEAFLNGRRIGDHVLDPGVTRYDKSVLYVTYDVTELLHQGKNAVGSVLGTGWYNYHTKAAWDFDKAPWRDKPVLKAQLEIRYTDGSKQIVKTDRSWKTSAGPIVFDGIFNGETYDARLENPGWNSSGKSFETWVHASEVKGPGARLKAQTLPPIRVIRTLKPRSTNRPRPGVMLFDFGENIAGRTKLKVSGPVGSEIVIRHGERLNADGTLDLKELSRFVFSGETQTSRHVLGENQPAEWSPSFTYYGFQYAEILVPENVETLALEAEVLHTDFQPTGSFSCSDTLLNRIHKLTRHTYLSNFHSYPTDCPHREKIGWSGDAHLVTEGALYNFDVITAYLKWIDDFVDEQHSSGQITGIIPSSGWGYTFKQAPEGYVERGYGPQWEAAFVLIPWYMYLYTGDTAILQRYYQPLKSYLDYLLRHAESDFTLSFGIDDHKALKRTKPEILATGFFFKLSDTMEKIAGILGIEEDRRNFSTLSDQIKKGYRSRFYDEKSGIWGNGGQTALAGTLYHGLATPEEEEDLLQKLLKNLKEKDHHLETGVVGTKYVIDVLTRYGKAKEMYIIASQTTFPSWGYWITQGANSLWQNWDGSQSRNHVMFGSIDNWFYQVLSGIQPDENQPGFDHVIIRPAFVEGLDWVKGSYESIKGPIKSEWKRSEEKIELQVEIPANTTATVFLPDHNEGMKITSGMHTFVINP
ncbi:MAG: family 78 glycoside hydrolase catalytic domain [Spirosomataceae bacterium]